MNYRTKVLGLALVLALALTACIPIFSDTEAVTLDAFRSGDVVTMELTTTVETRGVRLAFRGAVEEDWVYDTLEPGVTSASVTTPDPVSCYASGYVGSRYFYITC